MSDSFNNRSDDMGRQYYDNIVRRSVNGDRSSAVPSGYVPKAQVNAFVQKANHKIRKALAIGLVVGTVASGVISPAVVPKAMESIHETYTVSQEINDKVAQFHKEVVAPHTYRVNGGKDHAYEYDEIEKKLYTFDEGNFDKNVYYMYLDMDSYYTSKVLDYNDKYKMFTMNDDGEKESRSWRNYLKQNNFYDPGSDFENIKDKEKAEKNFVEFHRNRISINNSMLKAENFENEKRNELVKMMEDHNMPMDNESKSKGGL